MSLPHSVLDTSYLPPRQRLAAWRDSIAVVFDTRCKDPDDPRFRAKVDAFHFGEAMLAVADGVAQHFDRDRAKLARDGLDFYMLQFYVGGSCGRRDGDQDQRTRPGDMFIVDAAQPLATSTSAFRNVTLIVPRPMLAPLLRYPDEQSMRVIRQDGPLVALLRDHLCALHREAPRMSVAEAATVMRPTLQLAAAAINGAPDSPGAAAVGVALLAAIRRHTDANLGNPFLSADGVASKFGISRATLYRLFEPFGGFASYVRARRLSRSYAALTDPANRHRSVREIAESCGFADQAGFSRTFKRATGISARDVRHLASSGLAADGATLGVRMPGQDWARWIVDIC